MKAIFVTASLCFLLFSGFLKSEQRSEPASRPNDIAQHRNQIEILEERVEQLEKRLDRISQPRMVPLICIGMSRELP